MSIASNFPISNEEYSKLEKSFGKLTKYASWQLIHKNTKNNHTDEFDDVNQDLIMSLIRAGSYYKRQIYIERCFDIAKKYVKDSFIFKLLEGLEVLWINRKRHGAHKQKFGEIQEGFLNKIIQNYVPEYERPSKEMPLEIDKGFETYCKSIMWNEKKSLGKKITRERSLRANMVSVDMFSYLAEEA